MDRKKEFWLKLTAFGTVQRTDFMENLAGLIESRINAYDALREMERIMREEGIETSKILVEILKAMEAGASPAIAIGRWLSPAEALVVTGAGQGVELSEALRQAVVLLKARQAMAGAILGALIYPVILVIMGVGLLAMFATLAIPIYVDLVPAEKWEGIARFYYLMSRFIVSHGIGMGLILTGWIALMIWSLDQWKPSRLRAWLDRRVPPWNLYSLYQSSVLLSTIAAQVSINIPIYQVISDLERGSKSRWLTFYLTRIRKRIAEGVSGIEALIQPIFTPDARIALSLANKMAGSEEVLTRIGDRAREWGIRDAGRIGNAARTMGMVFVGALMIGYIITSYSVVSLLDKEMKQQTASTR